MQEGTKVRDFPTEVQILINNLGDVEERPSDTMIVEQVFIVLPPSFDSFVTNFSGASDMLTFDDLDRWPPRALADKNEDKKYKESVDHSRKYARQDVMIEMYSESLLVDNHSLRSESCHFGQGLPLRLIRM